MSNSKPLVDNSPYLYMEARRIWLACRERLAVIPTDNPVFDSVAALAVLAKSEMEKQAKELPF